MDRDDWNTRYAGPELVWGAGPNRFVAEELDGLVPGRALDLACGEGRNAIWLAELGWTVMAADWSDVAIERGRELAAARDVTVEWVVADVLDWEPPRRVFDLVLLAYLQLPEPARSGVLHAAAGAVADGGLLLTVAHDRSNLEVGHGGPQHPAVLATPEEVADVLRAAGLAVERAEVVRRAVETDHGTVDALDHVVRARRGA